MFEERIWTKKSSQKCEAWLQRSQKCEAWLQNNCWKATLGILFRESLNNLNEKILIKRKFEYIELLKKKKGFTISFYKFSNFELLHGSSLWVFIVIVGSYGHFILLSLSNIFIFILCCCYYLFVFVFIKIF